jgi:hypothetical protein
VGFCANTLVTTCGAQLEAAKRVKSPSHVTRSATKRSCEIEQVIRCLYRHHTLDASTPPC